MLWWGRETWRWFAVGAAGCVLALLVALTLRFSGLSATANLVQVLSVVPPVIGAGLDFARGRREGSAGKVRREVDFPKLLAKVAETHGISRDTIRETLTGWDTDALLDGDKPLEWDFVSDLLDVIADDDYDVREGLAHFVRSVWKAARNPAQDGAQHGLKVVVRAETGQWVSATEMTVVADQTAGLLQESARQLEISWAVLLFTLGKYAESIDKLKTERDWRGAELSALRNARQAESDLSARVRQLDSELRVVKDRLAQAEDLRMRTHERWQETERQLQRARELRDAALAQAVLFRQRLAGLENRPVMAVPGRLPQLSRADQVTEEVNQQVSEVILIQSGDLLASQKAEIRAQEAAVDRLASAASEGLSAPPPGGRRRAVLALAAAGAVIAASLAVVNLPGSSARHGSGSGRPSSGAIPGAARPTPAGPHLVAILHGSAGYIPESVSFGSDETVAVATTFSEGGSGTTYVWNLAAPHYPPASLPDPGTHGVRAVAFNHDGTKLAAVDANDHTYVWTVSDVQASPEPLADPHTKGHSNDPQAVAFSPGGPALDKVSAGTSALAVGDANGSTYLWNPAASHAPLLTLPAPVGAYGVRAVAFDPYPYSTTLAVGDANGSTYLWNLATPRSSPARLPPDPRSGSVVAVAYSADGSLLAVSNENGYTYVWNTAERKIVFTYSDPGTTGVEAAAFSNPHANTYTLAVGDINHSAYLWNVGASAGSFPLHAPGESLGVCSVAFSHDGLTLATANHDGHTYIWRLPADFS